MAISRELPKDWTRAVNRLGYLNTKTGEFIGEAELMGNLDLEKFSRDRKEAMKQELEKKKLNKVPGKVRNFKCAKCGELLLRVYPWANVQINEDAKMICKKCG